METHRGGTDEPETVDYITLALTSALGAGGFNKKRKRPSPTSEDYQERNCGSYLECTGRLMLFSTTASKTTDERRVTYGHLQQGKCSDTVIETIFCRQHKP